MKAKAEPNERVTKFFKATIRSVDSDTFSADVVISSEIKDRYNERVLVSSFKKTIAPFMQHGVLLSSHAYRGLMNQIGKFNKIWIDKKTKEVVANATWFVGEGNPEADWGWKLVEKGIAAFSIGFISQKIKFYSEEEMEENDGIELDYEEIELLETSQVLVPANPAALQRSFDVEEDEGMKDILGAMKEVLFAKEEEVVVVKDVEEEVLQVQEEGVIVLPEEAKELEKKEEVVSELVVGFDFEKAFSEMKELLMAETEFKLSKEDVSLIAEAVMEKMTEAGMILKKEEVKNVEEIEREKEKTVAGEDSAASTEEKEIITPDMVREILFGTSASDEVSHMFDGFAKEISLKFTGAALSNATQVNG